MSDSNTRVLKAWGLDALRSMVFAGLLATASVVWALPSPKEIQEAVDAGQIPRAESMLREVIAEKPQSAKAHYELGVLLERQERYLEAQTELKQAKTLEPSLKFTRDPQNFEHQLEHVNAKVEQGALPARSTESVTHQQPAPVVHESSGTSPLTLVWVLIAGLVIVALIVRRRAPQPTVVEVPVRTPQGFGQQYTPGMPPAPGGYPSYPPGYGPSYPPAGGSGIGSAVVGGVAGMAAGYALAKAMEGDHPAAGMNPAGVPPTGYVPMDNSMGQSPSNGVDNFASFEPSSDNSWDNSSDNTAGGSGDDNSW
jgi:uncharacterized protein